MVERKAFIRSFVKESRIMDDEAVSSYTMSLALDSTNEEKTGVLCSLNHGGAEEIEGRTFELVFSLSI